MTYANDDFWAAYGDYIEESTPRHLAAIKALMGPQGWMSLNVLDLGCGKHQEARSLFSPRDYIGVDQDPPGDGPLVLKADYRKEWEVITDAANNNWKHENPLYPDLVVSLFSVECTADEDANYALYQQVFRDLPTVRCILTSGFYYTDKIGENPITEAGGLTSWQTTELLAPEPEDTTFEEKRLYIPAPSKLFGPNVVEVWKLLTKRRDPE